MGCKMMEAAIEKQILSLEELSNDLIAANHDNGKPNKEDLVQTNFEEIVLSKLQNIKNMFESHDKTDDMMLRDDDDDDGLDDEILGNEDFSSDDLLLLLQNIRRGVLALDGDEVFKENEYKAAKQIKQENITIKNEPCASIFRPRKTKTMFLCPIEGCDFSTNKEGMYATAQRAGKAAQHLKMEHKIRAVDMR